MIRRRRNPLIQIILIALICLLGISSRRNAHVLPRFIAAYAGDTLWALAAFLGIGQVHHFSRAVVRFKSANLSICPIMNFSA